jgi:murein DD-endopeptidase MepM/ murein hydrolase activator NlpD
MGQGWRAQPVLIAGLLLGCAPASRQVRKSTITVLSPPMEGPCERLLRPVDGPLSSPFGRREGRPHEGIDLAVPDGTPVRAACDGQVTYAGARLAGYGNLLIVRHANARTTVYAHNQQLLVAPGQEVRRGQTVAFSGHSGRATAPHVHFELRLGSGTPVPVDPLPYFAPAATTYAARRPPGRERH